MSFLHSFWHYIQLSSPYLLLGLILAGFIKSFISNDAIAKWLGPKGRFPLLNATLIGIPLPLCSCSVIPTAVTLRRSGASKGATSAFLISTPESGVDSIFMTYAMIDLPMTLIRPFAAFISGLTAGVLQNLFNGEKNEEGTDSDTKNQQNEKAHHHDCCHPDEKESLPSKQQKKSIGFRLKQGISFAFGDLINDMAIWLFIGILVGAFLEQMIPPDFFLNLNPNYAKILIIFVGIPLYICASATTPIAAALIAKGMSPGTALLLLLVGPAVNISSLIILQRYLGKKGVILNLIAIIGVALTFSFVTDQLYQHFNWSIIPNITTAQHQHGEEQSSLFTNICSILLSGLVLKGIFLEIRHKWQHKD